MNDFTRQIVAGTGHRPDKLGGYSDEAFANLVRLAEHTLNRLQPRLVISGMALGWDQALARAAARLGVSYHAYVPFAGQECNWPEESQSNFRTLLGKAAKVVVMYEGGYAAWKMQRRNEAMVDAAGVVLALFDGSQGGTANCVRYAHSKNKPVLNLWQRYVGGDF